jgi:hypothetical protein
MSKTKKKCATANLGVPQDPCYKKDDEALLNLTGAMSRCSREKVLMCTVHRRGNSSPLSKYRGFSVYSMNITGGRRKMFKTRANAAS